MAAALTPVSFTTPYGAEEMDIQRRQRLAEALQAQGATPLDTTRSAGGWIIPVSPLEGAAKAAQQIAGAYGEKRAMERQQELGQRYQSDLANTLSEAMRVSGPHQEPVDTSGEGTGAFDMGGTSPATQTVPGSRERMVQALMQHPATQPLALQQLQRDMQIQSFMGSAGAPSAPQANPMVPSSGSSVMAGSGSSVPATPAGLPQGVFGKPAGGTPMATWLASDPSGKSYLEQLAKDYAPISTRYGIFQKQADGGIKAVAGALPQGALSYLPEGGVGALPGQVAATQALSGAGAAGRVPYETGTTSSGAQMPNYMIPGFQPPPVPGMGPSVVGATSATPPAAVQASPAGFPKETPADAVRANSTQVGILQNELADEQRNLAAAKTPEERDQAQANIAGIQRELDASQKRSGAAAVVPAAPTGYGQTTAEKAALESNEKQLAEEASKGREAANIATDTKFNLQRVMEGAQGFDTGRLTPTFMGMRSYLQSIAPSLFPADEMQKLTNYQEMYKYSTRLGFDMARKMGARESTQIVQMAISSNPNPEMVKPAIMAIGHGLMAQQDYVIAKEQARSAWRNSHNGTLSGFNEDWQANSDPTAFLLRYQSPQEQAAMIGKMDQTQRDDLRVKLQAMRARGII